MKIDDKNKFSYSENEEFEDLSEFDIAEETEQLSRVEEEVREVAAYKQPVQEDVPEEVYEEEVYEEPAAEV